MIPPKGAGTFGSALDTLGHELLADAALGEFDAVHDWLTENVQRHGKRYRTDELVEMATGVPLTVEHPYSDKRQNRVTAV